MARKPDNKKVSGRMLQPSNAGLNNFLEDIHSNSFINTDFVQNFQRVSEAKAQIDKLMRKEERNIVSFLREYFIERDEEVFLKMLAVYYNWSDDLLEKYYSKIEGKGLLSNLTVFKNRANLKKIGYGTKWNYLSMSFNLKTPKLLEELNEEFATWKNSKGEVSNLWYYVIRYTPFWNVEAIEKYKNYYSDFWEDLSVNRTISWSEYLLERYKDKWDYEKLIKNYALPWSKDFVDFLRKNAPSKLEIPDEIVEENQKKQQQYHSSNKHFQWTEDYIAENTLYLKWSTLSQNTSLPFSINFLLQHEDKWSWKDVFANRGAYEKVFQPILNDNIVDDIMKLYYT